MRYLESTIPGVWVLDIEPIEDDRGFFTRTFCAEEFRTRGLNPNVEQCNVSYNRRKGTLRGMHYQAAPYEEAKLVRCTSGSIYDVVVDLRPVSPTHRKWVAVELTAENRRALYVPEGCAHGFQTLEDDTEVFYQMSQAFVPGAGRGVRWDDPAFGIEWPQDERTLSERDRHYPDYLP